MKQKNTDKTLFFASLGGFSLTALSFLAMAPFAGIKDIQVISVISGLMFWLGLLMGLITQMILNNRRRKWIKTKHRRERHHRIGLFCFCKNEIGTIADIAMAISIAGLLISLWLTHSTGLICYFFMAFAVFFTICHCFFNGKNYNYIIVLGKEEKPNRGKFLMKEEEE